MSTVESRLAQHGISVPAVAAPVAAYIPAVRSGNLVFTSGQLPMVEGELSLAGIVGDGVAEADAQRAAGVCALNASKPESIVSRIIIYI